MKKKLLSILLILCLVLSLMPASAVFAKPYSNWTDAGTYDLSWYGDGSASAFTVSTPAGLAGLAYLVNSGTTFENKTVTLGADIDLSGKIWTPIGIEGHPFQGLLNGAGHTVSGMTVTTTAPNLGLFGLTDSAMLLNIPLSGTVSIHTTSCDKDMSIGGIVGKALGTVIENCSYTGDLSFDCTAPSAEPSYTVYAGGIAGRTNTTEEGPGTVSSYITNCSVVGNVTLSCTSGQYDGKAGGLVGEAFGTDILNCYHRGDVTSATCYNNNRTGGLTGELVDNSSLKNCYTQGVASATGAVTNAFDNTYLGLGATDNLFGDNGSSPAFVAASLFNSWITSNSSDVCRPWRDDTESVNADLPLFADTAWQVALSGNGAYRTSPSCRYYEIHYTPKGDSLSLPNSDYHITFSTLTGWGTARSGSAACTDSATPSGNVVLYALWQEDPVVPYTGQAALGKYSISTATQLAKLSNVVATGGSEYTDTIVGSIFTVTNDIDLSKDDSFDLNHDGDTLDPGETWAGGTYWSSIGWSTRLDRVTFLGNGHRVTGMDITDPLSDSSLYMGLFGHIFRCTIDSLYVSGSITLTTGSQELHNVYAGGLVGEAERSTLINCGADVDISITYDNHLFVQMGGLAGYLNSEKYDSTLNCYATGILTLSGSVSTGIVGGVAGGVRGDDVRNCYFAGTILCTATPTTPPTDAVYVGGITGYLRGGILTNCYYLAGAGITGAAGFRIMTTTVEGCGTFTGSGGALTPLSGQTLLGTDLLSALNAWIKAQSDSTRYHSWYVLAAYNGAYPQFTAPPTSGNAPISDTGDSGLPLLLALSALAALAAAVVVVTKRRRA